MLQQLKQDQLEARKTSDKLKTAILSTAIAEIYKRAKEDSQKSHTDISLEVIQKMLKTTKDMLALSNLSDTHKQNFEREIEVLEAYLPQALTAEEIRAILDSLQDKSLKVAMPFFKNNYAGKYDAKELASIIKSANC